MSEEARRDSSPRRMAPQDGGRGIEFRRRWLALRWFSWRYGTFWRRSHRTFLSATWHLFSADEVLFGVVTFEDEDGNRNAHVGLWPFHLAIYWTPWARPTDCAREPRT